jgi:hypothetical protein
MGGLNSKIANDFHQPAKGNMNENIIHSPFKSIENFFDRTAPEILPPSISHILHPLPYSTNDTTGNGVAMLTRIEFEKQMALNTSTYSRQFAKENRTEPMDFWKGNTGTFRESRRIPYLPMNWRAPVQISTSDSPFPRS